MDIYYPSIIERKETTKLITSLITVSSSCPDPPILGAMALDDSAGPKAAPQILLHAFPFRSEGACVVISVCSQDRVHYVASWTPQPGQYSKQCPASTQTHKTCTRASGRWVLQTPSRGPLLPQVPWTLCPVTVPFFSICQIPHPAGPSWSAPGPRPTMLPGHGRSYTTRFRALRLLPCFSRGHRSAGPELTPLATPPLRLEASFSSLFSPSDFIAF